MNRFSSFFLLSLLPALLVLSGCETDFDVNAPYEERATVYCVFESDTAAIVQQARVQKVFLTETDAQKAALVRSTSQYDTSEIEVVLRTATEEFKMFPVVRNSKDTAGEFFGGEQIIYETAPRKWDLSQSYGIEVRNKKTGYIAKNESLLRPVADMEVAAVRRIIYQRTTALSVANPFANGIGHYEMTGLVNYFEDIAGIREAKQLRWNMVGVTKSTRNRELDLSVESDALLAVILSGINTSNDPPNLERFLGNIEVTLTGVSEEIYDYQQINNNFSVVSQTAPVYTNIEDGLGVFGTRRKREYVFLISGSLTTQLKKDYPEYKF